MYCCCRKLTFSFFLANYRITGMNQQWQGWATHQQSFPGGFWPAYDQRYSIQGSHPLQPHNFGNQLTYIPQHQPLPQYNHYMGAQLPERQMSSSMNQMPLSAMSHSAITPSCFSNFQQSQLPAESIQPLYGTHMPSLSRVAPEQIQAQQLPPIPLHQRPEYNVQKQPSSLNQPSSPEIQYQTLQSQPPSRQYDKAVLHEKQPKGPKATFPHFEMQFPIFQKAEDAGGEMEKIIINRSHRLITEEDFEV
ncbi:hypothetical protein PRIPAC_87891 [Pristionchus pacificus]|uniref:Uncharacterized protein n=1 Tax=Pristionchus pacificus TaxID=54126 RepID=A0A2A6B3Z5_PRIPA|nr:hypothetical protein PRIPAC_87891 [Pristionchus pacificus]|eukprot:PDM60599.1 hypothetical protein PRIPAC_53577 [Pristionchus pacificus]